MNFCENLKILRKARGITQKQVAETIGMSEAAYQKYEYGTREPAFKYLIALADCYHISLDELVGRQVLESGET